MSITRLLTFVAALSLTGAASAAVIVDTGAGTVPYSGGYSLYTSQWLGAQFKLTSAKTITEVDGWIGGSTGYLHATILSDSFATLYSAQTGSGSSNTNSWVGASNLSWNLGPGTYYAAFEVLTGDTFNGSMDFSAKAHPTNLPLIYSQSKGASWSAAGTSPLGVRILGNDQTEVPEPGSIALIGLGLAGLALRKRKQA